MKIHELTIGPDYFDPLLHGIKTADYRKNDGYYESGDLLHYREYDSDRGGFYTGRETHCVILRVEEGGTIPKGYVLLSITRANISRPVGLAADQFNYSEDDLGD